jgi:hypothetical protein
MTRRKLSNGEASAAVFHSATISAHHQSVIVLDSVCHQNNRCAGKWRTARCIAKTQKTIEKCAAQQHSTMLFAAIVDWQSNKIHFPENNAQEKSQP